MGGGTYLEIGNLKKQYGRLVWDVAWHYARQYQEDQDTLECEAWGYIWERLPDYDQEKSSLSTFICLYARMGIHTYCRSTTRLRKYADIAIAEEVKEKPKNNFVQKLLSELSQESAELLNVIVHAPEELRNVFLSNTSKKGIVKNRAVIRKKITNYMIDALDWTKGEVDLHWDSIGERIELCQA